MVRYVQHFQGAENSATEQNKFQSALVHFGCRQTRLDIPIA